MTEKKLKRLKKDDLGKVLLSFIPNELGINLCSVDDIDICRQKNGELSSIKFKFAPSEPEPSENKNFSSAVSA